MSTLERWYNKNSMVNEPPQPCNFKVGDSVIFTNENGVEFGPHKVLGFTTPEDVSHGRFIHIDTDCAWFPVSPDSLRPVQPTLLHKEPTMKRTENTYTFSVTFSRDLSADLEVIGKIDANPLEPDTRKSLVNQLRDELQAAYDHPDVAPDGSFVINSITIDGLTYPA